MTSKKGGNRFKSVRLKKEIIEKPIRITTTKRSIETTICIVVCTSAVTTRSPCLNFSLELNIEGDIKIF